MHVKFNWNFDPGREDFDSYFSFNPYVVDKYAEEIFHYDSEMGSDDEYCKKFSTGSSMGFFSNNFFDGSNSGSDSEYFMNPVISPSPLPNDDIWKKFDIFDTDDHCDVDNEMNDMFDDLTNLTWMSPMYAQSVNHDAREIRNHDCMWAGHCISEKHDRNNLKNLKCVNLLPIKKPQAPKSEDNEFVTVSSSDGAAPIYGRRNGVVAPTHARSVLLPTRIVNPTAPSTSSSSASTSSSSSSSATSTKKSSSSKSQSSTMRLHRSRTLDSGGESPRPETPQSLSDEEDLNLDLPDMKSVEDFVADAFGYNFINDIAQNIGSEETNTYETNDDFKMIQYDRCQQGSSSTRVSSPSPSKSVSNKVRKTVAKQEVPISRHYTSHSFFSDHCYHLNKNARMDNLGVQTPSDSEEEIDVETVYGEMRKPSSRSSSSGSSLPTNPSFSDRQHLQLTVASAINSKKEGKKQSARTASVPTRFGLEDRTLKAKMASGARKANVKGEMKRPGGHKRSAHFDDYNEYINKSVKRKKCHNQHQHQHPNQHQNQHQRYFKAGKTKPRKNGRGNARGAIGGSSDSEVDSIERRTIHNSMERQRRIDLRNSFEELRKLIPHTAGNEKAAKVVILSYGALFCKSLTIEGNELTRKRAELRRQQEMLMARVSQLRRALAAQR